MGQYFENDESLKSEKREVTYYLKDRTFSFNSDLGVFSKNAVDFGTRTLVDYVLSNDLKGHGLDLGCGIGIIGITVSILKGVDIDMVDVNKRAVALTKENCQKYGLNSFVSESDIYQNVPINTYDFILTNPPIRAGKKVVHSFFLGAYDHLKKGGYILVVIQKKQGAPSAKEKLESIFGNCEIVDRNKGYYLLKSTKY